ncbi:hypothetical protein HK405_003211 [Cladochytrium tenue]|nr:hypothetical protein HK405_003211 [Cladochytrium tenue]
MSTLTNLLSNPNFSDYAWQCPDVRMCLADEASVAPWFVTKSLDGYPQYELDLAAFKATYDGAAACMDLNNIYPYTIGQWAATTPGFDYTLQYYIYSNEDCDAQSDAYLVKTGYAQVNGSDPKPFSYNDLTDSGYIGFTLNFTATVEQTLVEIGSTFQEQLCGPIVGYVGLYEVGRPTSTVTETETETATETLTETATETETLTETETDTETETETDTVTVSESSSSASTDIPCTSVSVDVSVCDAFLSCCALVVVCAIALTTEAAASSTSSANLIYSAAAASWTRGSFGPMAAGAVALALAIFSAL